MSFKQNQRGSCQSSCSCSSQPYGRTLQRPLSVFCFHRAFFGAMSHPPLLSAWAILGQAQVRLVRVPFSLQSTVHNPRITYHQCSRKWMCPLCKWVALLPSQGSFSHGKLLSSWPIFGKLIYAKISSKQLSRVKQQNLFFFKCMKILYILCIAKNAILW